jgi:Domain of unknown function (DUF4440)
MSMKPTTRRVSWVAVLLALGAVTAVAAPAVGHADSCVDSATGLALALDAPPCVDVLAQEARWLTAITAGDVATVESILGPTFRHVNADGQAFNRAQEIAATEPLDVAFTASDQIVDVYGDTAVIHGINTVTQGDDVVARERFIDVFLLQDGVWKAVTAQETVSAD